MTVDFPKAHISKTVKLDRFDLIEPATEQPTVKRLRSIDSKTADLYPRTNNEQINTRLVL